MLDTNEDSEFRHTAQTQKCVLCKHIIPQNSRHKDNLRKLDPYKLEFPSWESMNGVMTEKGMMHEACKEAWEGFRDTEDEPA